MYDVGRRTSSSYILSNFSINLPRYPEQRRRIFGVYFFSINFFNFVAYLLNLTFQHSAECWNIFTKID